MRATIGISTKNGDFFSYIELRSTDGNEVTFVRLEDGIGTNKFLVKVIGKSGKGLNLHVEAYAISIPTTTVPPTTETSTITTPDDGDGNNTTLDDENNTTSESYDNTTENNNKDNSVSNNDDDDENFYVYVY